MTTRPPAAGASFSVTVTSGVFRPESLYSLRLSFTRLRALREEHLNVLGPRGHAAIGRELVGENEFSVRPVSFSNRLLAVGDHVSL